MRTWRAVLVVAVVGLAGCGRPAQLGDEEALKEVDALYTAVTSRRAELVEACAARLEGLAEAKKLPGAAHRELGAIIGRARAGEWRRAAEQLSRFMKGQRRPKK